MQTPDRIAYPEKLEESEAALIRERRARAAGSDGESPVVATRLPHDAVGFGLSGGGIRSATFSLGVLQALAEARCLGKIDFLSTVSGGGYAGSFLGRLFTRDWVQGPEDVGRVLLSQAPPGQPPDLGGRVVRWLRDNGRYLAPRGSGDLLLLGSIALRNWIAVQVVMVTFVLTLFVFLQVLRGGLEQLFETAGLGQNLGLLLCTLPLGNSLLWWSPWLVVCLAIIAIWAVPAGWAYFLVSRDRAGRGSGLHPLTGALIVLVASGAGVITYLGGSHPERLAVCAAFALLSAITLGWLALAKGKAKAASQADPTGVARNVVSRWLATGLIALAALVAWTLLDTVARTIYAVATHEEGSRLGAWFGSIFAALAVVGAFARQIGLFVGSKQQGARPGPTFSTITWVASVLVVAIWLEAIAVTSYAVVWRLEPLSGKPAAIGAAPAPTILGTERVLVTPENGGFVVTAAQSDSPVCSPASGTPQQPSWPYVWAALTALLLMSLVFGHTRTFDNMSSMHAFYAARLTRTFLGASNAARHSGGVPVTETIAGDDLDADRYWRWPSVDRDGRQAAGGFAWMRGGPLHFVNVTVNETMDVVSGIQNQDRKGTGLAIGPTALSLGIRHHLVKSGTSVLAFPASPRDGSKVHRVFSEAGTPEALPLGRWVSISGAAFSTGSGSQTTVPMALLAGMFNVRLGYWWDSGMPRARRSQFARVFPVQYALFSEALARTRGTADRFWNLSDGGHFENLGGYELIRRRLPIIVIVDAEADPDYNFGGLAELVRKARMDFRAEITFFSDEQLSRGMAAEGIPYVPLPASVRPCFGPLEWLRRGRWSDEPLPPSGGRQATRFTIEVDRARVSRAHAALARVEYDNGDASWLVYVKATLMGDEAEDVTEYHRAHFEFPQEPTTDQFFDEGQWESYRRLGEHVGRKVLRPELFDYLCRYPAPRGERVGSEGK